MNQKFFTEVWPKIAAAVTGALLFACAGHAQIADFDKAAQDTARILKKQAGSGTVLVVPFGLSKSLRAALVSAGAPLVDTEAANYFFERERLGLKDFTQASSLAWMGRQLNAALVVGGAAKEESDSYELKIMVVQAIGAKVVGSTTYRFRKTAALTQALNSLGDLPRPPEFPPPRSPADAGVVQCGQNGVSRPQCEYCPNPEFTSEARQAQAARETIVLVRVKVATDGRLSDLTVLRGAPFGLTDAALQTIRTWRLSPCQNDKTAVVGYMIVEVAFRWHR